MLRRRHAHDLVPCPAGHRAPLLRAHNGFERLLRKHLRDVEKTDQSKELCERGSIPVPYKTPIQPHLDLEHELEAEHRPGPNVRFDLARDITYNPKPERKTAMTRKEKAIAKKGANTARQSALKSRLGISQFTNILRRRN